MLFVIQGPQITLTVANKTVATKDMGPVMRLCQALFRVFLKMKSECTTGNQI